MKFFSFNVNGLRSRLHQLHAIINQYQPDIIGLQETKVHNSLFPFQEIVKFGYNVFCHGQKGYYGVALLTKKAPISVINGFPDDSKNAQCRIIIAEIKSQIGLITLINGYFPNGENRNHSIKFLAKEKFYRDLQYFLEKKLSKDNLILIMGDMNISPTDLDIGIGENHRRRWLSIGKCSFLPEERIWINNLLNWGLVDIFRKFNPKVNNCFSWFDYRFQSFKKNRGLRIDLLLASHELAKYCIKTGIDYNIRSMDKPSDHAPVWAYFSL